MEIEYVEHNEHGFVIGWSKEGFGFGQLTFNGKEIDSEYLGDEFCREVFSAFVEKYLPEKFKNKK